MTRRAGIIVALLTVCALVPLAAVAQNLRARATVDSSEYLVGDWINVHVAIAHPKGTTFQSMVGDTLGGFSILRRLPMSSLSETLTTTGFVVARYDSSTSVLPPLTILSTVPGDTVVRFVRTNPITLTVRTVPVDTMQDIRDLKGPITLPYTILEILVVVGIVLVVAGIGFYLYRRWKRPKEHPVVHLPPAPARPAHLLALEQLGALKEKKLWQQGRIKEYYTEATEILRRYIENRYTIMALEETSDQILEALREQNLTPKTFERLEGILRRADLVKFAKHQPLVPEHEETLTGAYEFVERTRHAAAVAQEHTERAAANAGS